MTPEQIRKAREAKQSFWARTSGDRKAESEKKRQEEIDQEMLELFGTRDLMAAKLPPAEVQKFAGLGLYAVWPVGDDFVKLGKTDNDWRLATLQCGNPRELVRVVFVPDGFMGWTEGLLHKRFRSARVRANGPGREWFRIEGELHTWLRPALETAGRG